MHFDRISITVFILYSKGSELLNYDTVLSLKIVFILANSADPDEMSHYAVFHQGFHCLPICQFTGISRLKRVKHIF